MTRVVRLTLNLVESFWESFRLDPRVSENSAMRASDADREIVRVLLGEAYADGRLSREEYDDRLTILLDSRTLGALLPIVSDLVSPAEGGPPARVSREHEELRKRAVSAYRRDVQDALSGFLAPTLVCVAIWLLASHGTGFFWPAFVMLFTGVNLVRTVARREAIIEREVNRLEKKEARRLPPPPPSGP
jgi:hypothetical protein